MTDVEAPAALTLRRVLPATPEEVFDAWTNPDSVRQWLCPFDTVVSRADMDVRVGGKYRVDMKGAEKTYDHAGQYLEIDPPRRLVFTWISAGTNRETSQVTVELRAVEGGTELTLTHEGLPGANAVEDHGRGWTGALDNLQEVLSR